MNIKSFKKIKSSSQKLFSQKNSEKLLAYFPVEELDVFHNMVNQIGDEVMVIRKDGRIVFVNEATVRGLGYSKKTILQRSITEFFKEKMSLSQWQKTHLEELKKKKKPASYIIDRVARNGKVQTIDSTAVYMAYKSHEYVLWVARDITEQTTLQKKLQESEDRYRLLSEQAADGIFALDLKGRIVYVNKVGATIVDEPSSKRKEVFFIDYVEKNSQEKAWKCFRRVKNGVSVVRYELNIVDKERKVIPVEFAAAPIYKEGKVIQIHLVVRDISRKKQMEHLVHEASKMKALQHFIAGTTYEIYHPLKGLLDHAQKLIDKYKKRDFEYIGFKEFKDIMRTLETMRDRIKYCFDTTNRLVSINKRKVGMNGNFCEVNRVIQEVIKLGEHQFTASDIKLKLKLSPNLPPAAIGSLELNQVITNVLTNAIQSIPAGGVIQLKTSYLCEKQTIYIECKDDGVGISKENLSRVFEPFFTTKHRGLEKNSGLGLAIVYSIIKAFYGQLDVISNLRQGTSVKIHLPIYKKLK